MNTGSLENAGRRRFQVVRTLGEGTFGSVYLAEMSSAGGFKRRVALKLLNGSWNPDSDAGRRLRDEARLLGRLEHRHIVRVDDLIRLNGRWALVMEYVPGVDLEAVYNVARDAGGQLPMRAVLDIGIAMASALSAAWNAMGDDGRPLRVVHRDIKPSNVLLAESGDIKVLDFGVARAEFEGREARTERVRYGSLGYMSPERLLGEPETATGDVYALAVVLWELLTLRTYGRSELGPDQQQTQVNGAMQAIVEVVGEGARPLVPLLRAMLAYEPDRRPTAAEAEGRLRELLRNVAGDDVHTFARAFVPPLIKRSSTPDPAEGLLLDEESTVSVRPDLLRSDVVVPTPNVNSVTITVPTPIEPPKRSLLPWLAVAGVAGLLLLATAVVLIWAGTRDAAPTAAANLSPSAEASPANVSPTEAPAAVVAPTEAPAVVSPVASPTESASAPTAAGAVANSTRTNKPVAPAATTKAAAPAAAPAATPAAAPAAAAPAAVAPAPEGSSSAGATLRAAKFTLSGAEGIAVRCGGVSQSGTNSALIRDFPAGNCSVTASGQTVQVSVTTSRGVSCAVDGGVLSCR